MLWATSVGIVAFSGGCTAAPDDAAPKSVAAVNVVESEVPVPPPAPMRAYADTIHGEVIPDPFRWLEDTTTAEVRRFTAAQAAYSDSVLARLVGLDSLERLVARAFETTPTLDALVPAGNRLFLTRWLGPRPSLFVMDSGRSSERLLLSADTLAARSRGAGIRAMSPSWDGRYVAIGTTERGDARAAIQLLDATTGRPLPDLIPDLLTTTSGTRYEVTWLPDGSGFFYPRLWPGSAKGPAVDQLARGRQFLHRIGTPQSADVPVFGFGLTPSIAIDKVDLPTRVYTAPGSAWLVASLYRSTESGTQWFFAPLTQPLTTVPEWKALASIRGKVSLPQLRGDTVYALSRGTSDRGQIVRRVLRADGDGEWITVVPEQPGVIVSFTAQRDGLYFTERVGGRVHLRRVARGTAVVADVAVPSGGTVRLQRSAPDGIGAMFFTESWATPPQWQQVDSAGAVTPLGIDDGSAVSDAGAITAEALQARSQDGTSVPVSIVYGARAQHAGVLDGSAPLLIEAYGGYAQATDPSYNPFVQVWTALGGVYAYAHVRGGGELGDAWHTAGMREHKQRTFDDMIAAIETLIAKRYTSAKRVTLMGTSFGANIPGMVLAQRPDLLGAALFEVGQPDEIRGAQLDPTAARNIAELGDLETAEGIRLLRGASPYHQVPSRVALPGVIVHSASEDYNFGTEMLTGKYVARLQAANSGTRPVLWIRTDGGHQALFYLSPTWAAKAMSFALWQSGLSAYQPQRSPPADRR